MKTQHFVRYTLFIAVGVGLFTFSRAYERALPALTLDEVQDTLNAFHRNFQVGNSHDDLAEVDLPEGTTSSDRMVVSLTSSIGLGLITLGVLCFIPTLFDALRPVVSTSNVGQWNVHSARSLSIAAIWLAFAIVTAFSLYGTNFTHSFKATANALAFAMFLCGMAAISTAMLCEWRPWKTPAAITTSADTPPVSSGAIETP